LETAVTNETNLNLLVGRTVFARPYKVVEAEPVGRVALVISKAVAVNGGIGRGGK
jgi:hypothetical protein